MNKNPILEMANITIQFPGTLALDDVSISLNEGEVLALVGENGAGKSTLMKILSGTYPYGMYKGRIIVGDEEVKFHSSKDAEASGIAMIYQEISIAGDLTVAENVMLGVLPSAGGIWVDWKETRRKAEEAINLLHTHIDPEQIVRNLGASYQQLVCIARALVRSPKILILDEPTSALTESETKELMRIIRLLKSKGISCIYISHKLEEVFSISDRIIVLRDGRFISEYEQENFVSAKIVEDIIGRKLEVMFPEKTNNPGEEVLKVEKISINDPGVPGKPLLENVSFSLRRGEILGLAGLVGSGRSELLKALFGALPLKAGTISLNGRKILIDSPKTAIKCGIGLLTEDRKVDGYVLTLSVLHNMTITILKKIARFIFLKFRRENGQGSIFYKKLRIKSPSISANINQLSGGNQQKVLIAKWLLTEPSILFLDEPTRGVDVGTKAEIYKIMDELSAKGVSIIMVSSELPELIGMCDRIIVLNGGRIKRELSREEATENVVLHASAFGE